MDEEDITPSLSRREREILRQATVEARVHTLEATVAAQGTQIIEIKNDVNETKNAVKGLHMYLTGEGSPDRGDKGKLGELQATVEKATLRMTLLLNAAGANMLILIIGLVLYLLTNGHTAK